MEKFLIIASQSLAIKTIRYAYICPLVECILMHDQTMHRALFNPFWHSRFRTQRASCCTTEPCTERCLTLRAFTISYVACNLLHDRNHAQNVIYHFQAFTISCVACILMHDQTTRGRLFTSFGYSRFRATSCTLRFTLENTQKSHRTLPERR